MLQLVGSPAWVGPGGVGLTELELVLLVVDVVLIEEVDAFAVEEDIAFEEAVVEDEELAIPTQ